MSNANSPNPPAVSRRLIVASRFALLLVATAAAAAAVAVAVHEQREARDVVYTCPMHPEVTSSEPDTCPICHMALEARTLHHADHPSVDATAIDNLRKHGVIERVRKRSLLFDSREMRAPASVGDDGIVTALYYDDQISALGPTATFSPGNAPQVAIPLHRTADAPVRWDRSTSQVRFRLTARAPRLESGQAGWVEAPRKSRDVLTVPSAALLQSPEGTYVLVPASGDHPFEKRPIEIGETFVKDGFAIVLSGLRVHEPVVSRASFFLDADRRLGMATEEGAP